MEKNSSTSAKLSCEQMSTFIKDLAIQNAALSSEIHQTEEMFVRARLERRYLAKRLLQLEKPDFKSGKRNKGLCQSGPGLEE